MRIGEAVGGAALVGVAVLVGIALTDDVAPESVTADTSPFVFDATTSPAAAPTEANPPATSAPTTTSAAAANPTTTAAPAATTPATTVAPSPTLIPPEQRAGIAVRVLNGGAPSRAATTMSDTLRGAGFAPEGPADAVRLVPVTKVVFAPGRELDAATVNDVVSARPENVVPVAANDPNWTEFGDGLSVLVVLGPAGT